MKILTCVCLPDEESSEEIKKISEKISGECDSKRALSFPPHFTIRSEFEIDENNIENLKSDIINLCANFSDINFDLITYNFYPWRIIFIDIDKTNQLQNLHNNCMDIIEKYRTPWILDTYKTASHLEGKQKEYAFKYGYHFAYEFYSPHFTVAGNDMSEERFQRMKEKLKNENLHLKVDIKYLAFIDVNNKNEIFLKIPFVEKN